MSETGLQDLKPMPSPGRQIYKPKGIIRFFARFEYNKIALVALIILIVIFAISIFAPYIAPYDPAKGVLTERLRPPTLERPAGGGFPHIFGTDQQGRDVLTRIMYGGRVSLTVAFTVVGICFIFGTVLGLISGYFGGWVDMVLMRVVDVVSSFPGLLVALAFVMVLGPSERNLIIALTVNGWMIHARMARSQVLALRESAMVESARAIGVSVPGMVFGHILPNIISPLITVFVLDLGHQIAAEANMSFLGFGVQPPKSSWGLMIGEGRQYIASAWWLVTFPGIMIGLTLLCLNLFGNWVREEFDPLSRKH
ncbi:ABC transporter permease subunit [Thermanaerosceptrum fracticalcis]|uniref:ABC transporter permease subunit n=1 Tax=Thermanaerosceptrum fracticalcis TaxID=1712410 RepID=A0A7G6E7K2_THEFR|nr:ABC transporter permease [Thermanaerosceptrum fracticalcis]QNB48056.1 ABC transporter permease subunit [Thermanaerosceptrum fracticalcis]